MGAQAPRNDDEDNVLRTDLPDHRRSTEAELFDALRSRDALALAEVCHRTLPAAHACARRLLHGTTAVEALLRAVYLELWTKPPADGPLERWVRARTFAIAAEELGRTGGAPASPSARELLPDLPEADTRYLDAAERALAELEQAARRALLRAHDRGLPTAQQDDPRAAEAVERALLALAGPGEGEGEPPEKRPQRLADWILGLLDADEAERLAVEVQERPELSTYVRALRRGRRRLEGLPPTPDMAQRVLATALAGRSPAPLPEPPAAGEAPAAGAAPAAGEAPAAGGAPAPAAPTGKSAGALPESALDAAPGEDTGAAGGAREARPAGAAGTPGAARTAGAAVPAPESRDEGTVERTVRQTDSGELRLSELLRDEEEEDARQPARVEPSPARRADEDHPPAPPGAQDHPPARRADEDLPGKDLPAKDLAAKDLADEDVADEDIWAELQAPEAPEPRRSVGRRILGILGTLVILAGGAVLGLWIVYAFVLQN